VGEKGLVIYATREDWKGGNLYRTTICISSASVLGKKERSKNILHSSFVSFV
jgi:hypothetical protein